MNFIKLRTILDWWANGGRLNFFSASYARYIHTGELPLCFFFRLFSITSPVSFEYGCMVKIRARKTFNFIPNQYSLWISDAEGIISRVREQRVLYGMSNWWTIHGPATSITHVEHSIYWISTERLFIYGQKMCCICVEKLFFHR